MKKYREAKVSDSTYILGRALVILLFCLVWFAGLFVPGYGNRLSDNLQVEGNRFFDSDRLLAEIDLSPRCSLNPQLVEGGIERMLCLYEDNGFPYCRISPTDFRILENGEVFFSLLVEEGPQVKITEVQLEGLRSTKREVILRQMGKNVFGLFSQSRLDAGLDRVRRLEFIEEIENIQLLSGNSPEEGILRVCLRERRSNSIEGVLGFVPGGRDRTGNLFGSLRLAFDNIFGTGRMMHWNWSRKDPHSSYLEFSYREPWVLGLPPSLELKLKQEDRDSTYLKLSLSLKLLFDLAGNLSWGIEGGWDKVIPGPAGEIQIPNSRKYMLGATLTLDLLDRVMNPREGILYQIEVILDQKINYRTSRLIPERGQVSSARLALNLQHCLPILRSHALFVGIHTRNLFTKEAPVPLPDQFELGGPESIRGYREGEFFGTTVAWANLEYRFILGGLSRLYLFTDYGHFGRKARSGTGNFLKEISGKRLGCGMGLCVDSKAGLLEVDYGIGERDVISQGKIHFRLINRF